MLQAVKKFVQRETVLVVAWVLAIVSMFFVPPDGGYAGYVAIGNSLTNPLGGTELFPTIGEGGELWYTPKWYSPIWQLRRLKELAKKIDSSESQAKPLET